MLLTANNTDIPGDITATPELTAALSHGTTVADKLDEQIGVWKKMWDQFWPSAFDLGVKVILGIILLILGRLLIKLILRAVKKALDRSKADKGVTGFAASVIKGILYILLFITIAGVVGVPTASLIALLGSAGLAVGLALQGSLSNFAGGVLIMILKPFKVGNYIVTASGEGTVTGIDIFYTKLLTPDNRAIVIPNGVLSNSAITNAGRENTRRVDLVVPVSYSADIDKVRTVLNEVLDARGNAVLKDKPRDISVSEFGNSSVNMVYRFWVKSADYWTEKWGVLEDVKKRFDAEGIEIPFNQLDVNIKK